MPHYYLKKANKTARTGASSVTATVQTMLEKIKVERENAALDYTFKFDKYEGSILLDAETIAKAEAFIPEDLKQSIHFAHDNIRRFAEMQRSSLRDFEMEIAPGFFAGQKSIPVSAVGCYIPGGRYKHIASALMTVTTAKVAGVKHIAACSPPIQGIDPNGFGIDPAIVYAAALAGANVILCMGGVQAVATMTYGLFGLPPADMIVGPGNQFVAEAKRQLFGTDIGIDLIAGPTDSLILADEHADPKIAAYDLVGQAEHGYNSPVWLVTNDEGLAKDVLERVPSIIAALPQPNRDNAANAWRDYAEVIVCSSYEEMAAVSDDYAPEHLTVLAKNLGWWKDRLHNFGSLFLGEETTVAYGDKCSGPNHTLPTNGTAKYTGGLSVHKYLKVTTYQRAEAGSEGAKQIAQATEIIARAEGMEGHAQTATIRLQKHYGGSQPLQLQTSPSIPGALVLDPVDIIAKGEERSVSPTGVVG